MEVLREKLSRVTMNPACSVEESINPSTTATSHYNDTNTSQPSSTSNTYGCPPSLPMKLHSILGNYGDWVALLKDKVSSTTSTIIKWEQTEGRSFRILNLSLLLHILSEFDNQQSNPHTPSILLNEDMFRSQLDMYGFKQVLSVAASSSSSDYEHYVIYKHPLFIKGHPELAASMKPNTMLYYGSVILQSSPSFNDINLSEMATLSGHESGLTIAPGLPKSPHRASNTATQTKPYGSPHKKNGKSGSSNVLFRSQFNSPVYKKDKMRRPNADFIDHNSPNSINIHNQNPDSELIDPDSASKKSKRRFPSFSDMSVLSNTPTMKAHAALLENLYDPYAVATVDTPSSPSTYAHTQTDLHSSSSSGNQSVDDTVQTDVDDKDNSSTQHAQLVNEPIRRTYGRDEYQTSLRSLARRSTRDTTKQSHTQTRRGFTNQLYIATNQNDNSVSWFETAAADESCKSFMSYRSGCTDSSQNVPEHQRPLVPEADWGAHTDEWAYHSQRFDGSCVSSPQLSVAHHSAGSDFLSPSQRLLHNSGNRGGSARKFLFPLSEEDDFNYAAKTLINTPSSVAAASHARWGSDDTRSHGHKHHSRVVSSVNSSAEKPIHSSDQNHWFGNRKQFHELALLMIPKPKVHVQALDSPNPETESGTEAESPSARGIDSARIALDSVGFADVLRQSSDGTLPGGVWDESAITAMMLPPRTGLTRTPSLNDEGAISKSASFSLRNSTLTDDSDEES